MSHHSRYILETGVGTAQSLPASALTSLLSWHDAVMSSHSDMLSTFLDVEVKHFSSSADATTCDDMTGVGSSHLRFGSYSRFTALFETSLERFLKEEGESGGNLFDALLDLRSRQERKRRDEVKKGGGKEEEDDEGDGTERGDESEGLADVLDFVLAILDFRNFEAWMLKEVEVRQIAREEVEMMGF